MMLAVGGFVLAELAALMLMMLAECGLPWQKMFS